MHIVETCIQVERNLRRLRHVEVDVVLERIAHVVDVVVERVKLLTAIAQHTCLMAHVEVHEVHNLACTTTNVHVCLLVVRSILEHLLIPVNVRENLAVDVIASIGNLLGGVECRTCTLACHSLVVQLHEAGTVNKLRLRCRHCDVGLNTE